MNSHMNSYRNNDWKEVVSFLEEHMKTDVDTPELQSKAGLHLYYSLWAIVQW